MFRPRLHVMMILLCVFACLWLGTVSVRAEPPETKEAERTVDLTARMDLAGTCLLAWLNPKADLAPTGGWNVPHDIGRWWDAVLRLEARTEFAIPGRLEGAMLRNLDRFTDNSDHILLAPEGLDWAKLYFELHSIREGFLAFAALVKYRNSQWAGQRGHQMLESLKRRLKPDGSLDVKEFDSFKYVTDTKKALASPELNADLTGSTGRAIDGLMFFHEATGDPLALELAGRFAEYHMKHTVNSDGSMRKEIIDKQNVGHSHSYMGTLRGLWLYGLETGRRDIVDTVAATYRNGVQQHVITESGWNGHDLGKLRFPNGHGERLAETATAGDAAQLALWLALRAGHTDLLDDVERLLRVRLLPSQITSGPPKQLGGWGVHGAPYARGGCILDVAAAVLHTLTDIHDHVTDRTDQGVIVHLHLDCANEYASVSCRRASEGVLSVRLHVRDNLLIRVPGWTDRQKVQLTVNGTEVRPSFVGSYARVSKDDIDVNTEIVMRYDLPIRETTEKTDVGRVFRFRWQGDEIIGMDPTEGPQSLYPALK